ncbi:MAG: UDP-3-O-(3-hydroxymyristoyl)glucosamine N-acyltransferase [Bacteroidota bacterium]|nr:UDP-3-O-(3-hydroxymyristoyl)glucosamine N-acyltransferase [Bacteroidota bacterium]
MKLKSPISLKAISAIINAEYDGDPDFIISGINEIHKVENGDLTFVDHPKYYDKALNSAATTILINKKVDCPKGKSLIFSDDPFRDYNILTQHYRPFVPSSNSISPTAKIGKGTVIMPGAFVGNNCIIGDNCTIHPNVVIYDESIIGDSVTIHSNTVIGADAFYFKRRENEYDKMHSCGRVIIKDRVEIGASCTIDKGVSGDTIIGEGTKLDNQVHVGHDTVIGKNCLFAAQVGIAGVVTIEDNVILWGQVGVQKDLTIGSNAIVLGQSGVPKSLEGGKIYFGSPTRDAKDKMKEIALLKNLQNILLKQNKQ